MSTVLLIGASSDIGINLAISFKKLNYHVVACYCNNPIKIPKIETIKCDITKKEEIEHAIEYTDKKYGKIDILINLAATYMDQDFFNKTKEEIEHVLEVNLVGSFLCHQAYAKYNPQGLIIHFSSTDGIDTYNKYNIDYAISKAGLISMCKIMHNLFSNRVICLCPNWINSSSTKTMDKDYLQQELTRIGQSRLIEIPELITAIHEIINNQDTKTVIYRIDIKENKLWIEKY